MDIKTVFEKNKSILAYLFFGVLTTVVNIVAYWILAHLCNFGVMLSTIVAWIASVLFAYITNRMWVFHSATKRILDILKEMTSFFTCRLATGFFDWACMFIFVDCLKQDDMAIKILANIIVIILNYLTSKMFVFKKHNKQQK